MGTEWSQESGGGDEVVQNLTEYWHELRVTAKLWMIIFSYCPFTSEIRKIDDPDLVHQTHAINSPLLDVLQGTSIHLGVRTCCNSFKMSQGNLQLCSCWFRREVSSHWDEGYSGQNKDKLYMHRAPLQKSMDWRICLRSSTCSAQVEHRNMWIIHFLLQETVMIWSNNLQHQC